MEDIQETRPDTVSVEAPAENETGPLVLTTRDIAILKLVHEQRYLAFNQIRTAFWKDRSEIANAAYKRLMRLVDSGFLEEGYSKRKGLNLYLLAEKGYSELQRQNLDLALSRYELTGHYERYVDHDLKVSSIRILFNELGLVNWTPERVLKEVRREGARVPDGIVTIGGKHVVIEFENRLKSKPRYKGFFESYASHKEYYLVIIVVYDDIKEWLLDLDYDPQQVWFVGYEDLMNKRSQALLENKHEMFALERLL